MLTQKREEFGTDLLLISHHEFSPSFLSFWTLHLVFIDYSVPFRTSIFREGFEEIFVYLVVQPKTCQLGCLGGTHLVSFNVDPGTL